MSSKKPSEEHSLKKKRKKERKKERRVTKSLAKDVGGTRPSDCDVLVEKGECVIHLIYLEMWFQAADIDSFIYHSLLDPDSTVHIYFCYWVRSKLWSVQFVMYTIFGYVDLATDLVVIVNSLFVFLSLST